MCISQEKLNPKITELIDENSSNDTQGGWGKQRQAGFGEYWGLRKTTKYATEMTYWCLEYL